MQISAMSETRAPPKCKQITTSREAAEKNNGGVSDKINDIFFDRVLLSAHIKYTNKNSCYTFK